VKLAENRSEIERKTGVLSVEDRVRFLMVAVERRLIVTGYEGPSYRGLTADVLAMLITSDDRAKLLKALSADANRPVHQAIAIEIVQLLLSGQLPQFSVVLKFALEELMGEDTSLSGKFGSEHLPGLKEIASDTPRIFRLLVEKADEIGEREPRQRRTRMNYEIVATDQMRRMMREGLTDAGWIGALTLRRLPRGHTRIVKKFLTRSTAVVRAHLAMIEYTEEGLSEEILSAAAEKLQKRIRFRVRKGIRSNLAHCRPVDWSSQTLKAMANSAVNRYRQRAVRSQ
jgi:hypothetical protein